MNRRVLLVDDEQYVLDAMRRSIGKSFTVDTARSASSGLAQAECKSYAAIVSDYRMPLIDGIQFLAQIRERQPHVVRLMLTGHADLEMAIAAVNEGNIFQLLTKPCAPESMLRALEAAVRQHQLITSERDLLEKTLNDSIALMSEILSLVNPAAFRNASRIRRCVTHIVAELRLPNSWEFELAAQLSQIGYIAVPPEILAKRAAGEYLNPEEEEVLQCHAATGYGLLTRIPRLDTVAEFVRYQSRSYRDLNDPSIPDLVAIGAQALAIATFLEDAIAEGRTKDDAIAYMLERPEVYHSGLAGTLHGFEPDCDLAEVRRLTLPELRPGMVLDENLQTRDAIVLASGGQRVSRPMIERLNRVAKTLGLVQPFQVRVPVSLTKLED